MGWLEDTPNHAAIENTEKLPRENWKLNFRDPGITKYLIPGFGIGEHGGIPGSRSRD